MNDPYSVLDVSREASEEKIEKAYRRSAKKYPPDSNPGDPEAARKMNEIHASYDDKYERIRLKSGEAPLARRLSA